MFFGKRKKRPNERMLDLKARVDALRRPDEAEPGRAYSLQHFLEGDDVLTSREVEENDQGSEAFTEDVAHDPSPEVLETAGPPWEAPPQVTPEPDTASPYSRGEVDFEAELQRYLARERAQETAHDGRPQTPSDRTGGYGEPQDTEWRGREKAG